MTEEANSKTMSVDEALEKNEYKYGFTSDIDSDTLPKGLNEDVVRAISLKKKEPQFMLDFRLKAYRKWLTMKEPAWPNVHYPKIDFQNISYYSAPKPKKKLESLDEVDPELLRTFEKLGIPLDEQKRLSNVAVDAVFDSVSVATTHKKKLMEVGIIFCPISEALQEYPELVEEYLAPSCRLVTTIMLRSTAPCSLTVRSSIFRRTRFHRWSCPLISASIPKKPGSSNAR